MNTEFSIKKSTIEVYYIRPKDNNCGWADISIDEGDGHPACEDYGCAIEAGIPIQPPL